MTTCLERACPSLRAPPCIPTAACDAGVALWRSDKYTPLPRRCAARPSSACYTDVCIFERADVDCDRCVDRTELSSVLRDLHAVHGAAAPLGFGGRGLGTCLAEGRASGSRACVARSAMPDFVTCVLGPQWTG